MPPLVTLASNAPIIMLDDSEDDRLIAEACLRMSRLENVFVGFGQAKELFAHLELVNAGSEPMPALLLLDLNMPDMSGFDVLARTRSEPTFNQLPIIVALTNSDNPADRERVVSLGANGFKTKEGDINAYRLFFDSLAPESVD